MLTIVGITGNYHAGKDTFGQYLIEELAKLRYQAKRFAFADELKRMAEKYFKWNGTKDLDITYSVGSGETVTALGGRSVLQGVGSIVREFHKEHWAEFVGKGIADWYSEPMPNAMLTGVAVVTDMRFMLEVKYLERLAERLSGLPLKSGKRAKVFKHFVQVRRPGHGGDSHASETEQNSEEFRKHMTYSVDNDTTLEDLRSKARTFAKEIILIEQGERV